LLGIIIAALVFVGMYVVWRRGDDRTGYTVTRDDSPRTERTR
jgi:hypothetical protein